MPHSRRHIALSVAAVLLLAVVALAITAHQRRTSSSRSASASESALGADAAATSATGSGAPDQANADDLAQAPASLPTRSRCGRTHCPAPERPWPRRSMRCMRVPCAATPERRAGSDRNCSAVRRHASLRALRSKWSRWQRNNRGLPSAPSA